MMEVEKVNDSKNSGNKKVNIFFRLANYSISISISSSVDRSNFRVTKINQKMGPRQVEQGFSSFIGIFFLIIISS